LVQSLDLHHGGYEGQYGLVYESQALPVYPAAHVEYRHGDPVGIGHTDLVETVGGIQPDGTYGLQAGLVDATKSDYGGPSDPTEEDDGSVLGDAVLHGVTIAPDVRSEQAGVFLGRTGLRGEDCDDHGTTG